MKKVGKSSFLAVIPLLLWNLIFYSKLPEPYQSEGGWNKFPPVFSISEKVLLILTIAILFFLVIEVKHKLQKVGLIFYAIGVILYLLSWIMQIYWPESVWSISPFGFSAPALSPFIWLIGLGMMSKVVNHKLKVLHPVYFMVMSLFILIHVFHALIVYYGLR